MEGPYPSRGTRPGIITSPVLLRTRLFMMNPYPSSHGIIQDNFDIGDDMVLSFPILTKYCHMCTDNPGLKMKAGITRQDSAGCLPESKPRYPTPTQCPLIDC